MSRQWCIIGANNPEPITSKSSSVRASRRWLWMSARNASSIIDACLFPIANGRILYATQQAISIIILATLIARWVYNRFRGLRESCYAFTLWSPITVNSNALRSDDGHGILYAG